MDNIINNIIDEDSIMIIWDKLWKPYSTKILISYTRKEIYISEQCKR